MKTLSTTIVLLTCLIQPSIGEEPRVEHERPAAPKGFQWQELQGASGSFVLVPDKWHFETLSTQDSLVYRVTKDNPKTGNVLTGLTINVVRDVKEKTGVDASLYGVRYIDDYMKTTNVLIKPDKIYTLGPFKRASCQVEKTFEAKGEKRLCRVRVVTYANDKTGTLFVVIFGAPTEEWDEAWKVGEQLFRPLLLSTKL